jgi:HSP20 family protein
MTLVPTTRGRHEPTVEHDADGGACSEFEEMHPRTGQLIERTFGSPDRPQAGGSRAPLVDVEETDDAWVFDAELPGVKRENINVEVGGHELAIRGAVSKRERRGVLHRSARRTGEFNFRVGLPTEGDPKRVEGELHHGVLTVRVPKSAKGMIRLGGARAAMLKPDLGTGWSLARGMAVGNVVASVRSTLAMIGSRSRREASGASFDPVRVEAELYEALYGQRTGTVESVAPVGADLGREGQETPTARAGSVGTGSAGKSDAVD